MEDLPRLDPEAGHRPESTRFENVLARDEQHARERTARLGLVDPNTEEIIDTSEDSGITVEG